MSDSRLEKFIYAICSMDVTDLPVPLSRIEKLWNCLITGETPDFEPLSRNEKYLMAMLDRYDISNLPAPMSRGEKLLYKIAVGETDLSDVPGYLSRYEELLKYLIENGGISGGDFEYVLYTINQSLYTLYTTAEKPVKSAILKGNTLVNLSKEKTITITTTTSDYVWNNRQVKLDSNLFKAGKKYLYSSKYSYTNDVFNDENPIYFIMVKKDETSERVFLETKEKGIFTIPTDFETTDTLYMRVHAAVGTAIDNTVTCDDIKILEYQNGMENWDIPYFEGMQSVKMPVLTTSNYKNLANDIFIDYGYISNGTINIQKKWLVSDFISIEPNVSYTTRSKGVTNDGVFAIAFYDKDKNFIVKRTSKKETSPTNAKFVRINVRKNNGLDVTEDEKNGTILYLEKTTEVLPFEEHKSNILTVNDDVTLRGIGDVQDTLDCLTGEVVQNIGEIVLDGSENWSYHENLSTDALAVFSVYNDFGYLEWLGTGSILCDKFPVTQKRATDSNSQEGIYDKDGWVGKNKIPLIINKDRLSSVSVDGLKLWLSNNQLKLQFKLQNKSIKTVDLTILNQDNQPTQLGTFENITHVSLESAGLIPEVEMEVATKLLEDTVFNLTNAFNTLYPTAAKPVVDGTLYGQTLVNVATQKSGRFNGTRFLRIPLSYSLKSNTNYFVNFIIKESTLTDGVTCRFKNTSTGITFGALKSSGIITINANVADILEIYIENTDDVANGLDAIIDDIMVIEYQEGMENWDIPYFEGMQSVQAPGVRMTGKNMFDDKSYIDAFTTSAIGYAKPDTDATSILIETDKNTDYILSAKTHFTRSIIGGSTEPIQLNSSLTIIESNRSENTITFNSGEFTHIMLYLNDTKIDIEEIQVEKGTAATPYEPHRSIILSTPSDLELRKVGEVQDEVNVMTGEVVERVGEIVLDGSEDWILGRSANWKDDGDTIGFYFNYTGIKTDIGYCDKLLFKNNIQSNDIECFSVNSKWEWIGIRILKSKLTSLDAKGIKQYLQQNTFTIQYQLATPTTKTVDLSVVNQDGNETKLRTFDETTHVLLNSEGVPMSKASLTVRTKIPSASSTSLLMADISTNQQQLEATVDEQSNNVDATMIATTEIYEETL